jgi:hypothetical protein
MYVGEPDSHKINFSRVVDADGVVPSVYNYQATAFVESLISEYPATRLVSLTPSACAFSFLKDRQLYVQRVKGMTASGYGVFDSPIQVTTGLNIHGHAISPLNSTKIFTSYLDYSVGNIYGRYVNMSGGVLGTASILDTYEGTIRNAIDSAKFSATAVCITFGLNLTAGYGKWKYITKADTTPSGASELDIFTTPNPDGIGSLAMGLYSDDVYIVASDYSGTKLYGQRIKYINAIPSESDVRFVGNADQCWNMNLLSGNTGIAQFHYASGMMKYVNIGGMSAPDYWNTKARFGERTLFYNTSGVSHAIAVDSNGELGIDGWASSLKSVDKEREVFKNLEIGPWDLRHGNNLMTVYHGLTGSEWKTIRSPSIIIRNDYDTQYYPTPHDGGEIGFSHFNSTDFLIWTQASGQFWDAGFSASGAYNRGWVTFFYEPAL